MKKLFLCIVLLGSGFMSYNGFASVSNAQDGPMCPANAPCLYTGDAKSRNGLKIPISVHRLNDYTTDLVAKFTKNGETQTAYVFRSENPGEWYFSWNSIKYYFEM